MNKIILGHALTELPKLPSKSVNCVVTSPPYWGLRDYGIEPVIWDGDKNCKHEWKIEITKRPNASGGKTDWAKEKLAIKGVENYQEFVDYHRRETESDFCLKCNAWRGSLGLEPTFELYIKHLCDIFDEVKRVLRKDGTCWVNLGDSYSGGGRGWQGKNDYKELNIKGIKSIRTDIPDKSLMLIPQRFAIEMVNRGWILRNTIIWHKPNCMPSSAKDRFTVDFEYVFFFTKSNKAQFWTNEKTLECVNKQPLGIKGVESKDWECNDKDKKVSLWTGHDYWFEQQFEEYISPLDRWGGDNVKKYNGKFTKDIENIENYNSPRARQLRPNYPERERDLRPNKNGRNKRAVWTIPTQPFPEAHFAVYPEALIEPMIKAGCPKNGIVLDPFMGAGTTAVVAKKQGKRYLGIEIKQEYIDMANKRIRKIPELLF